MTFELTENLDLIRACIQLAFDRPAMLRDGADPLHGIIPPGLRFYRVLHNGTWIGMFAVEGPANGFGLREVHACLMPIARRGLAVQACREFLAWLPHGTVRGRIPAYNRPMRWVAALAGMKRIGTELNAVKRDGKLWDELIFERVAA